MILCELLSFDGIPALKGRDGSVDVRSNLSLRPFLGVVVISKMTIFAEGRRKPELLF